MKNVKNIVKSKIEKITEISKDRRMLVMAIVFIVAFSGGFTILLEHPGSSGIRVEHSPPSGPSPETSFIVTASASQNPIDANESVKFSVSPNDSASYSFQYDLWTLNPSGSYNSTILTGSTSNFSYAFNGKGNYSVVWSVVAKSTNSVEQVIYNESVHRDPIISASASTNITKLGKPISFTGSVEYGVSPYHYSWECSTNGIDFSTISTAANPSLYFNTTGTYYIYFILADTGGYTDSSNWITIHVYLPPLVSISTSHSPSDVGVPVQFNATPSGGSGVYAYEYTLYDGQSSSSSILLSGTSNTFSYAFFSQGNYLLSWEVTSSNLTGNSSIIESVNNDPTVSISENKTTTDSGNPIGFASSVQGGTSPYYYSWYSRSSGESNYSLMSTNANPSFYFNTTGTYFVYASLRDGSGYRVNSSIVAITVNPLMSGNLSLSPSIAIYGNPEIKTFLPISGGSGGLKVNWFTNYSGGYTTCCPLNPTNPFSVTYQFSINTRSNYSIGARIHDSAGSVLVVCASFRVVPSTIKITPHVPAQVPQNSVISLSAQASSFIGPNVTVMGYSWVINNKTFSGKTISYDFTSAGIYHIFVSAWGSYQGSNDSNTTEVNITSLPPSSTPNIVIMPLETNVSGGIDFSYWVTFHNNTSFSAAFITVGGTTYQPSNMSMFSNGTVHISKSVRFSTLQEGSYSMNLQVINNQSQQKDSNITFSVSLQQSGTFSIYSIANFFGGYYNFLAFVATIASLVIAYVGLQSDKRPPVININENGKNVEYQLSGKRVGKR